MSLRLFKQTAYQREKEIAWSAFPATKSIYSRGSSRDWTNSSKKNLAPLKWRRGRRLSTSSWMFKSRFYKKNTRNTTTQTKRRSRKRRSRRKTEESQLLRLTFSLSSQVRLWTHGFSNSPCRILLGWNF